MNTEKPSDDCNVNVSSPELSGEDSKDSCRQLNTFQEVIDYFNSKQTLSSFEYRYLKKLIRCNKLNSLPDLPECKMIDCYSWGRSTKIYKSGNTELHYHDNGPPFTDLPEYEISDCNGDDID
jgi:hypothetical protein